jgi:hypothetical protein
MYQIRPQQPRERFSKQNRTIFLGDNKSDEMMANVLELYPQKNQYIFRGEEGLKRKQALQQRVRDKFNMLQEADEYEFSSDEEYADFLKGLSKKIKKGLKQVSIKNVQKGLKQVSIKNVKKGLKQVSLKNIGKGLKKIGQLVVTAALALPRGAMLGLVKLNFRGAASRFALLNAQGRKKLLDAFEKLGGQRGNLENAIDTGKKQKPLICGKKCRAAAGKNPQMPTSEQAKFSNAVDPATAGLISAGLGTLTAIINQIKGKENYDNQAELEALEGEVDGSQAAEDQVDATMTPQEAALADEVIKAQDSSYDAVKAITENPNLTADEKSAALLTLQEKVDESKASVGMSTTTKILIGVGVVAALGLGFYLFKKRSSN